MAARKAAVQKAQARKQEKFAKRVDGAIKKVTRVMDEGLNERLLRLEKAMENMATAFNQNNRAMTMAFNYTDAHIFVIQRVLHDLQLGVVQVADGKITFDWYYWQYQQALQLQVYAETVRQLLGNPYEAAASEEDDIIFGGST